MNELRIEHFKSLKEEHRQYKMNIQQLWLVKLTMLGSIVAVAFFSDNTLISNFDRKTIVCLGLILLPMLSMIIDLKVLEYSLYIKSISMHLIEKFKDVPNIWEWESVLWAGTLESKIRTWVTIVGSVGLSLCILLMSFQFAFLIKPDWGIALLSTGSVLFIIPIITATKVLPMLIAK